MQNKSSDQDRLLYFLDYAPAYRLKLIKELIGSINGKKAADIGCGKGSISFLMWTMGAEVYSFDISSKELQITKSLGELQKSKNKFTSAICKCDARNLPIIDEAFDTILCLETLEHIQNDGDKIAVSEIERTAKRGAKIILSVPYTKEKKTTRPQRYRHYTDELIRMRLTSERLRIEKTVYWYFPTLVLLERLGLRFINASIGSILLRIKSKNPGQYSLKSREGYTQSLLAFYKTSFWRKILLPAILVIISIDKQFQNLPVSNDVFLILKKK